MLMLCIIAREADSARMAQPSMLSSNTSIITTTVAVLRSDKTMLQYSFIEYPLSIHSTHVSSES